MDRALRLFSMFRKPLSALARHARASSARRSASGSLIDHLALALDRTNEGVRGLALIRYLAGGEDHHVHRPRAQAEELKDRENSLGRGEESVHLNHEVNIAVGAGRAAGAAAEEHDSARREGIDDAPDDVLDRGLDYREIIRAGGSWSSATMRGFIVGVWRRKEPRLAPGPL